MLRISLRFLALAGVTVATLLGPSPAQAADIYKYWAYFGVEGDAFVAQSEGPGNTSPADGTIEAYRYAAPADFNNPNLPRADLSVVTFDAVCGEATAAAGEKRVAVLVDYGVETDAPEGEETPEPEAACAVVPEEATGLQTLQEAFPDVRTEASSFGPSVCGIEGYPATGCLGTLAETGTPPDGEPVEFAVVGAESESDANASDDDDNNAVLLGVGAGVVVLIVAGGLLLQRRRNRTA
jgi:hypothetical protein